MEGKEEDGEEAGSAGGCIGVFGANVGGEGGACGDSGWAGRRLDIPGEIAGISSAVSSALAIGIGAVEIELASFTKRR